MMKGEKLRSPYESLRFEGSIRATIIGYGIAGVTVLLSRSGTGGTSASLPRQVLCLLLGGLGLQALLFIVRALTARYERAAGLEGYLSPLVVYIFELTVDAVTVFLFAWATYRGLLSYAADL
ncbi:MAG TPA: hypothetical protein VLB75_04330 [Steroidobacteraceae bacterium]|nr:hypothetical protein [Steroidobacteraceae bacterium]